MKLTKVFFTSALILLCFSFFSCTTRSTLEGKWKLDADSISPLINMYFDQMSETEKNLAKIMARGINLTVEFKNDNTCIINFSGWGQNHTEESNYKIKSDKIFLFDQYVTFKIEDNTLTLSNEDFSLFFNAIK